MGFESLHPCLTTDWILEQFGTSRAVARRRYCKFVEEGMEAGSIWKGVKGQIILGSDGFAKRFSKHIKTREAIKEIPRLQRYINRPGLGELFAEDITRDRGKRNGRIREAVERHGYSQKEVSDHLGLHYSTISRLLKET